MDVGTLLHVQPGQYEVIALNTVGKHVYTRLDNDRLLQVCTMPCAAITLQQE